MAGNALSATDLRYDGILLSHPFHVLHNIGLSYTEHPMKNGTVLIFPDQTALLTRPISTPRYTLQIFPAAFQLQDPFPLDAFHTLLENAADWPVPSPQPTDHLLPPWDWVNTFHSHHFIPFLQAYQTLADWLGRPLCSIFGATHFESPQFHLPDDPVLEAWVRCLADHPRLEVPRLYRYSQRSLRGTSAAANGLSIQRHVAWHASPAFNNIPTPSSHDRLAFLTLFEALAHANPTPLQRPPQ
jgi:hypothetical protein